MADGRRLFPVDGSMTRQREQLINDIIGCMIERDRINARIYYGIDDRIDDRTGSRMDRSW